MSRYRVLGHISPIATHIMTFLMGASLLFEAQGDGTLGPWKGVLLSLPSSKGSFENGYLVKNRRNPPCLLHSDPFYLHRREGDTLGILIPKDTEFLPLIGEIVSKRVRLVEKKSNLALCDDFGKQVVYE